MFLIFIRVIFVRIIGLGWVAIACLCEVEFRIWAYDGVAITRREAIFREFAPIFERYGFGKSTVMTGPILEREQKRRKLL